MARGLAKAGATIVVAARNKQKSDEAVKELKGLGAGSTFIPVDVEKEASCRALIASPPFYCVILAILKRS